MKVAYRLHALILALSLFVCACDDSEPSRNDVELRLQFSLTDANGPFTPINFAIYTTAADYASNTNAYITGKTDAATGKYLIPASQLEQGREYYIDWYSDDYTINNWSYRLGAQEPLTGKIFTYTGNYLSFGVSYLGEASDDQARKTYLNGNDAETNWKAVGLTLDEASWNTLPEYQKYVRLKIRKDGTGVFVRKNQSGTDLITPFTFTPNAQIIMKDPDNQERMVAIINLIDNEPGAIELIPIEGHWYKLVKE